MSAKERVLYEIVMQEFLRRRDATKLRGNMEDYIQECWCAFFDQEDHDSLLSRIQYAVRMAKRQLSYPRKMERGKRYQIIEEPASDKKLDHGKKVN
jgi:hypothetical protein